VEEREREVAAREKETRLGGGRMGTGHQGARARGQAGPRVGPKTHCSHDHYSKTNHDSKTELSLTCD
jgi:hypothetical protein